MSDVPGWVENFGKCPRCYPRTGGRHCACPPLPDAKPSDPIKHRERIADRDGSHVAVECACGETWSLSVLTATATR